LGIGLPNTQRNRADYKYSVSLADAASLVAFIKAPFYHFKKKTSKSFSQFVNELRIGLASKALINTDRRVSEICYEVGFGNLAYFNWKSKALKGVSPSDYRKQFGK